MGVQIEYPVIGITDGCQEKFTVLAYADLDLKLKKSSRTNELQS